MLQLHKHSKAYKFYHQLIAQRRSVFSTDLHYTTPGHPLKYFKDNWDGTIDAQYFEPFQYRSTMPRIITEMKNVGESDPVADPLKQKYDWHHGNTMLKMNACYVETMNERKDQQLNDEVMECPKYLIELAARLANDPDPNFDATYNWYYTGNGNMQIICVNWVDYMLYSVFGTVYLSRFNKDSMTTEREIAAKFNCGKDVTVHETICSPQNIVALRTKQKIFLLKIIETEDKIYFEKLKNLETESSYTGISFDKHQTYILYATAIDSTLEMANMNRMTRKVLKLKQHRDSNINNWNCIIGVERCSYMHVERDAITLYDKRTNNTVTEWTGVKQIVDTTYCNDITIARLCEDSPSLFFATDHHIFLMDTRASRTRDLKAVQRWTHGLKCAATYMSINKADSNKELITISSQWCEDTCVISNYANSVIELCEIKGVTMPYHPPNILDVLKEARLKMLCLDIHNSIENRLVASITGQVVVDQGENFSILSQNSLGDIFFRNLYPEYMNMFIQDDSVQRLHDWSKSYKLDRNIFEVSSIVNMSQVWKKLKKIPDSYSFSPKNAKDYYDESKIYKAFENEELLPELMDAWVDDHNAEETCADQSSLMLNLHYEDSDE
ncbi:unnamed protein product [Diatraea saccharalis]|nr:unnamed protein product [Diatraea saccharalis]